MPRSLKGDLVLVFITLCWGITFPLIENAMHEINPFTFVMIRFSLATLILLPFMLCYLKQSQPIKLIQGGIILGILNTITYSFQSLGMVTVTASHAAFITGISVIIVPFILPLFSLGKPNKLDVFCSLICLIGLFFLTGADLNTFNLGDFWILICAFFVAITIVYLQKISQQLQQLELLAFYQIIFTAFFSGLLAYDKSFYGLFNSNALIAILFCSIVATSLVLFLQTKYQKFTTANRAAMIFCLEPIFGSLFGYLINGEKLTFISFVGATLIILSIFGSEFYRILLSKWTTNEI